MSGGGGKGGSQTTSEKIPEWLERASQDAVARGSAASDIGYVPYTGPEIAAFNRTQEAAFRNNANMARDLGLQVPDGPSMPPAQDFGGGVWGYGSYDGYKRNLAALRDAAPGQVDAINSFFIDPMTGQIGSRTSQAQVAARSGPERGIQAQNTGMQAVGQDGGSDPRGALSDVTGRPARNGPGYTGLRDMFDGGGPGASGGRFQGGGLLSDAANLVTGRDRNGRSIGRRR